MLTYSVANLDIDLKLSTDNKLVKAITALIKKNFRPDEKNLIKKFIEKCYPETKGR